MTQEDSFLLSLDGKITDEQKASLEAALSSDTNLKKHANEFLSLRQGLLRPEPASFGPFFAERVVNHLRSLKKEIDLQIFFFFRKYQLAAIGVVIALVAANVVLSDNLSVKSILGLEEPAEDLVTIDLYQSITN